ncbi:hypothetical protein [Marinifilum fragile]|uniref:hypothetical protein n=1 Tax=Marinifilum fragile TaxID=570161 RepID=UPI002AA664E9|nr:hypothetical protein [Marinifilum fragile]
MKLRITIVVLSILFLFGCVSKSRETELLSKIEKLELELDELKNGDEKLYSEMKHYYQESKYPTCKSIYIEMEKRHTNSKHFVEVKDLYTKILRKEEQEREELRKKKEQVQAEEKRKIELEKQKKLKALKKLKKSFDDVSGNTWYYNPYFTHYNNKNLTSLYIGKSDSYSWLRLKMSYQGSNWIFFERVYLSYDGNTKEVIFDKYDDKETENSGGGVWEWIDVSVSKDLLKFLRDFSQSPNAKMRLSGKYTETRNLTWNERQGIRDVIKGYDALNE